MHDFFFFSVYLQIVSTTLLLFYYESGLVCESVQSVRTCRRWSKYFSYENPREQWDIMNICLVPCELKLFCVYFSKLTAVLLFSAPFTTVPLFCQTKTFFKRKGMRCFPPILITEVSVCQALGCRRRCDSCSLLKISTRGFYFFLTFFSDCICPTWHNDWWQRGNCEVMRWNTHSTDSLRGQWKVGPTESQPDCCAFREDWKMSLFLP